MKKILIISFTDQSRDPRVRRQVDALIKDYKITCAGIKPAPQPLIDFVPINKKNNSIISVFQRLWLLFLKRDQQMIYEKYQLEKVEKVLLRKSFDIVICNDLEPLALALRVKGTAKLIWDAHEYYPDEIIDRIHLRLLLKNHVDRMLKKYARKADLSYTVSNGCIKEYKKNYNIDCKLMLNATNYVELKPKFNMSGAIKMVHHGVAVRSRKMELMIYSVIQCKKDVELDLYLLATGESGKKYLAEMKDKFKSFDNIKFLEPIPFNEIAATINKYDIGFIYYEPTQANYKYSLPNKFFEYIQARIAVAISPLEDLSLLVKRFEIGIISENFKPSSMANAIEALTFEAINNYKINSDKLAKEMNADSEIEKLVQDIQEILE